MDCFSSLFLAVLGLCEDIDLAYEGDSVSGIVMFGTEGAFSITREQHWT